MYDASAASATVGSVSTNLARHTHAFSATAQHVHVARRMMHVGLRCVARQKRVWRCLLRMRVYLPVVVLCASATLLTACRVDTKVDVTVDSNGSGMVLVSVTMDGGDVVSAVDIMSNLETGDMEDAGWAVEDVELLEDEKARVKASKKFESVWQLQMILDELAGVNTIFSNVELTREHVFARSDWYFEADINPSPSLEIFSDDSLAAMLDGAFFGRPIDDIQAKIDSGEYLLKLALSLTLPADINVPEVPEVSADNQSLDSQAVGSQAVGSQAVDTLIDANISSGVVAGSIAEWIFSYGDAPTSVSASATAEHRAPVMWYNVSRGAAVAFALAVMFIIAARVMTIVQTPKGRGRRATRHRKLRAATRVAEAGKPPKRFLRLLVVDAHGVIVRPIEPLEELLLPMIRSEIAKVAGVDGADIDKQFIVRQYHALVLGRITPDEFWSDVGLGPVMPQVETKYLASYRIVPGLHSFLDSLTNKGLPVVVVSNHPRHWGERLKRMGQLEETVSLWLTSGEVGAALPSPSLLEAARRKMSVSQYDCLYLSGNVASLDAARELGMSTAYFAATPNSVKSTSHTLVRGFNDILRARNLGSTT